MSTKWTSFDDNPSNPLSSLKSKLHKNLIIRNHSNNSQTNLVNASENCNNILSSNRNSFNNLEGNESNSGSVVSLDHHIDKRKNHNTNKNHKIKNGAANNKINNNNNQTRNHEISTNGITNDENNSQILNNDSDEHDMVSKQVEHLNNTVQQINRELSNISQKQRKIKQQQQQQQQQNQQKQKPNQLPNQNQENSCNDNEINGHVNGHDPEQTIIENPQPITRNEKTNEPVTNAIGAHGGHVLNNINELYQITEEQKLYYKKQFQVIVPDLSRAMTSSEAKNVLLQSGLPIETLSRVWELSDIGVGWFFGLVRKVFQIS